MPTVNQLTKLFQAIASNNQNRAQEIAVDIIASEEKKVIVMLQSYYKEH